VELAYALLDPLLVPFQLEADLWIAECLADLRELLERHHNIEAGLEPRGAPSGAIKPESSTFVSRTTFPSCGDGCALPSQPRQPALQPAFRARRRRPVRVLRASGRTPHPASGCARTARCQPARLRVSRP